MRETRTTTIVGVRDLAIDAMIGVDVDEQGRSRPLVVSVEACIDLVPPPAVIEQTLDYAAIAAAARDLASRPIGLIEDFARQLGERCLSLGPVTRVRVDVAKPGAIADGLAATSVTVERASASVLPFARASRSGPRELRFRFNPDINPDAQRKLSWLLGELAESIHGVEMGPLTYDPATAEWNAKVTLGERRAPRIETVGSAVSRPPCDVK